MAAISAVLVSAVPAGAAGRCGSRPWCDTSLSDAKRTGLLVRALTPDERIGLLGGDVASGISGQAGGHTGEAFGVPRLGVPPLYLTDGPVGVRQGRSTALPASIALAASFDRRLARAHARVVATEARLKGNDAVYAPTVNLLRTPLWGRGFESLGEDPFLTSRLGVAWIRAAQDEGVIANVKHFAVNNQEGRSLPGLGVAGSRYSVDVRVGERPLRELYLPQFEAAIKEARVGTIMCSYNRLNGPHACESRPLLDRILRRDWGFKGFVLADYAASKQVGTGLRAGLDFEPWPFANTDGGESYTPQRIRAALAAGRTTQAAVDRSVRRILRTLFAYGFFDRAAYSDDDSRVPRAAHLAASRRVAEAGTVLLKNRRALPLDSRRIRSLAVVGADADRFKNGGGSSQVTPYSFTTPRQGLTARAGPGVAVRYDPGTDPAAAAAAARGADAAIVVVADAASEFADKPCIALDCGRRDTIARDALIERVAAVNPRTIVVLETSAPVLTPWRDRVEAIVAAWYPGDAGGTRARQGAVWRCGPGRPPARHLPAPRGRPAGSRAAQPLSRHQRRGPLLGGPAGGVPLVRRPPPAPCVRVRPWALVHALRARQPSRSRGAARRRRAPIGGGGQPWPPARGGRAPALPRPARPTRPQRAAAPAQGVQQAHDRPGSPRPRAVHAERTRLLHLERAA